MRFYFDVNALSFQPLIDLPSKSLEAFINSVSLMFVVVFAAIPWVALFLLVSYGALRFLRWWIRRRLEMKERNKKIETGKIPGQTANISSAL